ncbi:MafI family immunity protein (plasmid) [Rhizobium leguminosarum]|nr:MafI family immunity protein [Rhizobium leguminosarum]
MEIEKRLIDLISDFNGRLAGKIFASTYPFAEHNECVVALENLCT